MTLINKLFGAKEKPFQLRFSKSLQQWEVVKDAKILYLGSKEACNGYIKNMTSANN